MVLKRLFKCGGSLVFPIPREYAAALRLQAGCQVIVRVADRRITCEKAIITGASDSPTPPPVREP